MARLGLLLALLLPLIAAPTCDTPPDPPPGKTAWCHGLDDPSYRTVAGGYPSVDRRSTVVVINESGSYYTGVIIGPRAVLTSAHAITSPAFVEARDNAEGRLGRYTVDRVIIHPGFDNYSGKWYEADLAIIVTQETMVGPYAPLYHPVLAPKCTEMVAQGFGGVDGVKPWWELHESQYYVVYQDNPDRPYRLISEAVVKPGGTRKGDSGGALWALVDGRWYIVGILSHGWTHLARSGHIWPWYYKDWITDTRIKEGL